MIKDLRSAVVSSLRHQGIVFEEDSQELLLSQLKCSEQSEFILFDDLVSDPQTCFWSEGFQMLSAWQGTFAKPYNLARCPDNGPCYRITSDDGFCTCYSHIILKISPEHFVLIGFTSCNKGQGAFRVYPDGRLVMYIDYWGTKLTDNVPGESFCILEGTGIYQLRSKYARLLASRENSLLTEVVTPQSGWCSWYWYYADVTAEDIQENAANLDDFPDFNWVLIDDGYQNHMGDWLIYSRKFPRGLNDLAAEIKRQGRKVALWVSPFIVSSDSELFKNHQDWLAVNAEGKPLNAGDVTYGGWRDGDWYLLDFSVPEVQKYIHDVFSFFYNDLGIEFFKLDALYWGCIKGSHYRSGITPVENYRLGLNVIRNATEGKAFILGCNAPLLPSVGLVHGMRLADDVVRDRERMVANIDLLLYRLWMQEQLFLLDPDCLCLKNNNSALDEQVFDYHCKSFQVLNGVLMLGDRLSEYSRKDKEVISAIAGCARERLQVSDQSDDFRRVDLISGKNGNIRRYEFDPDTLTVNVTEL